jgi:hypothetical protein
MLDQQEKRISKISRKKRYHADTMVQTTHFLKKCAILPEPAEDAPEVKEETKEL